MPAELPVETGAACERLDERLRTLLPAEYRDTYEELQPVSMGSAGLKYDGDGNVAWDQIWGSFCDLAMAGGPPHKGMLLREGAAAEIDEQFGRYDAVVEEICRGIKLVTGLRAYPSMTPGWVSVTCQDDPMAGWLQRAIIMENVAARRAGAVLDLPAAPHFRIEKEIKNVITVIAKTCHYWLGHIPPAQQRTIGELFMTMSAECPLVEPGLTGASSPAASRLRAALGRRIQQDTGLSPADPQCAGWLGLEAADVRSAVWLMRALVASNVLSRRERRRLFVPVNASQDPDGSRVASAVARVYHCAAARGLL